MDTRTEDRVPALPARLMQLLHTLDRLSPTRFPALIARAKVIMDARPQAPRGEARSG